MWYIIYNKFLFYFLFFSRLDYTIFIKYSKFINLIVNILAIELVVVI